MLKTPWKGLDDAFIISIASGGIPHAESPASSKRGTKPD
jgi:hypothetical protein